MRLRQRVCVRAQKARFMRCTKITAAKFTRQVHTKLDSSLYEAGSQRSKPKINKCTCIKYYIKYTKCITLYNVRCCPIVRCVTQNYICNLSQLPSQTALKSFIPYPRIDIYCLSVPKYEQKTANLLNVYTCLY